MNETQWRAERDSRSKRYAGRVLDPERWVLLRCTRPDAAGYDGQVALLTAANLLARMTPSVALDIPAVPIAAALPWAGRSLHTFLLEMMYGADPNGRFRSRPCQKRDYLIHLGRVGAPFVAHGSGWNCYLGEGPSPLPPSPASNPIGPSLAAILAVAIAFRTNLQGPFEPMLLNAFDWRSSPIEGDLNHYVPQSDLGDLWTIGTGSVGTAILYFLTLATRNFSTTLFDMDTVQIHNLDRSPIFPAEHVGWSKVRATEAWLRSVGVSSVRSDSCALDESEIWTTREAGAPDLLIPAANERNVRSAIETNFPPIQIYGTTGKNWQAAMIRHIPMKESCSSCLFPEMDFSPTNCATGDFHATNDEQKVDAALPFLSFAAGAMAAAEILKTGMPSYPFTPNRVILNTRPHIWLIAANTVQRDGCVCLHRSAEVHQQMIAGTRFAALSSGDRRPPFATAPARGTGHA